MRPIIGITARPQNVAAAKNELLGYLTTHTYTDSVLRGGGIPVLLLPVEPDLIDPILDRIDGVVLTGGGDIAPERYGAERHDAVRMVNRERDEFELSLVTKAYERKMPMLAICRGNQVVNVAFGGTLIQDLPSHSDAHGHDISGEGAYEPHSQALVEEGSKIASIFGAGLHGINSIHHQAIEELGVGLKVVASAPDGTVEALEHEDKAWDLLSVQWHPEYLGVRDHGDSHDLFTAFVDSAAKYAANS
ncbi:MAG: gamma-glutamyl-gamma-aminobutyrate hydrolase family protein [Acidimicrobiia bacterium]